MTVDFKSLIRRAKDEKSQRLCTEDPVSCKEPRELHFGPPEAQNLSNACGFEGVRIINDFLTAPSATAINEACADMLGSFVQLRGRKCLPLGGRVTSEGLAEAANIPFWLERIMDQLHSTILKDIGLPRPNHALINVYEPGEGIMAHEDGPAYAGYAAILSLGSSCVFDFVSRDRLVLAQVYLPVGSLLIFSDFAYSDALHQYSFSKTDQMHARVFNREVVLEPTLGGSVLRDDDTLHRGRRISITMRQVPPVVS